MKIQQSHKNADYLEVFQEVTRLISSVHDPQEVMDLVVQRLPDLLEVDAATIRLLEKSTGEFVLGSACGLSEEYLSRATIDSREVMNALRQGQPMAVSAMTESHSCGDHDSCQHIVREGIKSVMSLPIIFKGRTTGLLRLLTREHREFTEQEVNFTLSLAEQVGVAIVNGKMFTEMENQVRFLSELRGISKLVHSTLDLDEILALVVEKLPSVLHVKACTIRLLHPATNRLELVAASGLSSTYLDRGSISREDAVFRVLKGEPVAIYDALSDTRVDYHDDIRREGIRSILVLPIKNHTEVIGVLRLLTDVHHSFTASETNFAMAVAEEGGNAIQKARTYRKITLLFKQIEEQERFLQVILDSLWLQLLVVDPQKRFIMVNQKFLETTGLEENEVLGRLYDEIVPWRKDDLAECSLDKVLLGEKTWSVLNSMELQGNAGVERCYEHHLVPIVNTMGEVDFVMEVVRDVSSEKLLEKEQMKRVKLEGVVEMAGTAAHELNTPLFAALGTAELLRDDLCDPDLLEEVDMILRNLNKIAALTHEMSRVTGFEVVDYVGETKIMKLNTK